MPKRINCPAHLKQVICFLKKQFLDQFFSSYLLVFPYWPMSLYDIGMVSFLSLMLQFSTNHKNEMAAEKYLLDAEWINAYTYHGMIGFPHSSVDKESACNAGDLGSIPGLGRSPGEGDGNSLQYSCLENPMDRGAWQALQSIGSQESDMTYLLNHHIIV